MSSTNTKVPQVLTVFDFCEALMKPAIGYNQREQDQMAKASIKTLILILLLFVLFVLI